MTAMPLIYLWVNRNTVELKPIKTDADHEATLKEIERLWDAEEGTADGDRLEILTTLVEAFEAEHFAVGKPRPTRSNCSLQGRMRKEERTL